MNVKAYELILPGEERHVHITSLLFHPPTGKVFIGTTDMRGDLLYTFDPKTKVFESCNFRRIADRYDVKIHRSLVMDRDGSILGATAGLHGVQEREHALGGKIFRYDPRNDRLDLIARPVEREYIQSILHDPDRRLVYGFTYPVPYFFRYALDSGDCKRFYIDSLPHLPAIDDEGCVWATWGQQNSFFKYDPGVDKIDWKQLRLPRLEVTPFGPSPDPGQVDCMISGADGYLYVGSVSGALYRFDPAKETVEYLGKPGTGLRMSALTLGEDGKIYGITGMEQGTFLFAYDRDEGRFQSKGPILDPELKDCPYITHHIIPAGGGTFYSGETDNPRRSGYLWESRCR